MDAPTPIGNVSLSDILSAAKNIVTAISALAQNYINVQGLSTVQAIAAPTVVKGSGGRVCRVSVTIAGSTPGMLYDGATLAATTKPIWIIPAGPASNGDPYQVNLPVGFGILVVPGTSQQLTVSYS